MTRKVGFLLAALLVFVGPSHAQQTVDMSDSGFHLILSDAPIVGIGGLANNFNFTGLPFGGSLLLTVKNTGGASITNFTSVFQSSPNPDDIIGSGGTAFTFTPCWQGLPNSLATGMYSSSLLSTAVPVGGTLTILCSWHGTSNYSVNFGGTAGATTATLIAYTIPAPLNFSQNVQGIASDGQSATSVSPVKIAGVDPGVLLRALAVSALGTLNAVPQMNLTPITTATTTAVKATSGVLHAVTINTGVAGTIKLFDVVGASCTGTPGSGAKGTITVTASTVQTLIYDGLFTFGICIVTSAASDVTVSWQ